VMKTDFEMEGSWDILSMLKEFLIYFYLRIDFMQINRKHCAEIIFAKSSFYAVFSLHFSVRFYLLSDDW